MFDAAGQASACAAPEPECPAPTPASTFADACRLHGFQLRKCGCTLYCSGNVATSQRHYDPAGVPRTCESAESDCTPPETSASFQDACNDGGHRLVQCGCEWLCDGPLKNSSKET